MKNDESGVDVRLMPRSFPETITRSTVDTKAVEGSNQIMRSTARTSRPRSAPDAVKISILFSVCLSVGLIARPLRAEDEAAGRVLFNEATKLANDGNLDAACPKFAESLRQNYNINAHYFLADCLERQGKTATAWSTFLSVATAAKDLKDERREHAARTRADALEGRLVKLRITVAQELDGLEVRRNQNPVGKAMWGSVIPVDPGEIEVTATAPCCELVRKFVTATEPGTIVEAVIPALSKQPSAGGSRVSSSNEPLRSLTAQTARGGDTVSQAKDNPTVVLATSSTRAETGQFSPVKS